PPVGIAIPDEVRAELQTKLTAITKELDSKQEYAPDIEVFTKAVTFALAFDEFYDKKDFDKARWALQQAEERLALAKKKEFPWRTQTGTVVRGFRSAIDGSVQPYGVVTADKHDFRQAAPAYVWLHGRGDKQTDLHFIYERARNRGDIAPPGVIVVHPFGRQCIGFKSAGETDVREAFQHATTQYKTHGLPVLVGFSMGGAGAWHLGAHYPNQWRAVCPGAGFADVARYQKLKPENYPSPIEQALWGVYDVPCYTRNLFNLPVIAYSGEIDPQKQAADLMAAAFEQEGRKLTHLIGPGTAHKYHPETKQELLAQLAKLDQTCLEQPATVLMLAPEAHLQTRTLRYNRAGWLEAVALEKHWQDARLDGTYQNGRFEVTTKNVTQLKLTLEGSPEDRTIVIDGQTAQLLTKRPFNGKHLHLELLNGQWRPTSSQRQSNQLASLGKYHGLQGPIDDAFLEPFLVVLPSGNYSNPRLRQWVDFEIAHLKSRWAGLFRGELPVRLDVEITADDMNKYHLVCFGDGESNNVIAKLLPNLPIPVAWTRDGLEFGGQKYAADRHVPVMIYPNPSAPKKYMVLNSGPTFREAHDRTNSLQNPKLPDWAIIDITTPPDATAPGKVVAADFFDEQWQFKPAAKK
ncbi:MAG TPA: alpha/beta hydrolase-fold protein, partial [Pirellulaceae bacterium]|nr:alpha/beta hydrolase-fold protein [Pirellulaceae bacterium]